MTLFSHMAIQGFLKIVFNNQAAHMLPLKRSSPGELCSKEKLTSWFNCLEEQL